jgi:hypothetical protein
LPQGRPIESNCAPTSEGALDGRPSLASEAMIAATPGGIGQALGQHIHVHAGGLRRRAPLAQLLGGLGHDGAQLGQKRSVGAIDGHVRLIALGDAGAEGAWKSLISRAALSMSRRPLSLELRALRQG